MKMRIIKYYLTLVIFSMFASAMADIAIAGASSRSVVISSEEFENEKEYLLEINIVGVDPRTVSLEPHGQMLVLEVRKGNIKKNARAGSQEIFYTYSFSDDADMLKMSKLHSGNKIRVAIPKR
jgi:HSP20 family molecular chaperone IbpA